MSVAIWVGYPKSYTSGRIRAAQFVCLHYTAGSEGPSSAENGAIYDKNRLDGTSTHYFTDSFGPALQEVPEGDRSHAALFHGNEIGIHIEICGTRQTREQWLDEVSYPTLVMTAALTREICDRNGFDLRILTVEETRMAYYGKDFRPTGITDHSRCTLAFPEDGGDHMDVGDEFPWDVFMGLVISGTPREGEEVMSGLLVATSGAGADTKYWVGQGFYHREIDKVTADNLIGALKLYGAPDAAILSYGGAPAAFVHSIIGPTPYLEGGSGGAGLSFAEAVEAATQGAKVALNGATINA